MPSLHPDFFDQTAESLAIALLGTILRRRVQTSTGPVWLAARIIETEAYYRDERGSHSSLGYTEKRRAMFMPPGTIYMYYARGGDSLNFSAAGDGNGVLIKSAFPHVDPLSPAENLVVMQRLNPGSQAPRPAARLCNGQTLLCKSLDLKVPDWNQRQLKQNEFRLEAAQQASLDYIQCPRLGIPVGRDHELPYRFVEAAFSAYATKNPLTCRGWREGIDYRRLQRN